MPSRRPQQSRRGSARSSTAPGPLRGPHPRGQDTGLSNLPLHGFDQNRIWCQIVQLACELISWAQLLGYAEHAARRWEPKRLRLRLFATAASLAHHARVLVAHLAADHPWTDIVLSGRAAITGVPTRPG